LDDIVMDQIYASNMGNEDLRRLLIPGNVDRFRSIYNISRGESQSENINQWNEGRRIVRISSCESDVSRHSSVTSILYALKYRTMMVKIF
jgi:hypothetical protein